MTFKAVALDIDGTLLNSKGMVTPITLKAIQKAYQKGLLIMIASGRMTPRVKPYAEMVGVPASLISYNGAQVWDSVSEGNWNTLVDLELSAQARDSIYALCKAQSLHLNVYSQDRLHAYHPFRNFEYCDFYHNQTKSIYVQKTDTLEELPQDTITKLLIIDSPEARNTLYNQIHQTFNPFCDVMKSNPEYLEFLPKGASKSSALDKWLKRHGLRAEELIAFGDAENDLDMLQYAGAGIALKNATPGLKANYQRISKWSNDEDAIAKELEFLT